MARLGPVRSSIRSDNGSYFVGVADEIRKAVNEMNDKQVKHLQKNESDWITWENNAPATSHMGGV